MTCTLSVPIHICYSYASYGQSPYVATFCRVVNNGEILEDNASMLKHAREFYQSLFGKEPRRNFKLDLDFWEEDELVRSEENELVEAQFSEEEIKKVIFDSYAKGAPGPDGFSFLFYQKFWTLIKHDFMALVRGFEKGKINVARLNYAIITLIPKEE
jgi:hypothetical protein